MGCAGLDASPQATARAARIQQGQGFQPIFQALEADGPSALEIASNPRSRCVLAVLAVRAGVPGAGACSPFHSKAAQGALSHLIC